MFRLFSCHFEYLITSNTSLPIGSNSTQSANQVGFFSFYFILWALYPYWSDNRRNFYDDNLLTDHVPLLKITVLIFMTVDYFSWCLFFKFILIFLMSIDSDIWTTHSKFYHSNLRTCLHSKEKNRSIFRISILIL